VHLACTFGILDDMCATARRNSWGGIRELPSGRYQAHYRVDYVWHKAPETFRTKREANAFLARTRADIERGKWVDPRAGTVLVRDYAAVWLAQRPGLRPRTRELYEGQLRLHVLPVLGDIELGKLSSARVRSWHSDLVAADKPGTSTVAKCYRLLHAILETAAEDDVIVKNPCAVRGAAVEHPAERPIATLEQVFALADAIEPPFRAMVLLATFTGLRLGELRALKRSRLDLLHRTANVVEQYQELADGSLVLGEPKTDAGRRTVALPAAIVPELEAHLAEHAAPGRDGLVFVGTRGHS
jgi:integrase